MFSKKFLYSFLFFCLGIVFIKSLLGLHGFSLMAWRNHIDGSQSKEVIWGQTRENRSDEWAYYLPFILSQTHSSINFNSFNTNIGIDGHNMEASAPVPTKSFSIIFRPALWGYFFSSDFGLAWQWNFRLFLLFFSSSLFFIYLSNSKIIGILLSIGFVYSSFFQFWSLDREPMVSVAFLSLLVIDKLVNSKNRNKLYFQSMFLAYLLCVLALSSTYPPWQIQTIYFMFVFTFSILIASYKNHMFSQLKEKLKFFYIPILLSTVVLLTHIWKNKAEFNLLSNTVYPGLRRSMGGGWSFARFIIHNFIYDKENFDFSNSIFGNICESSGFYLMSPILGVFLFLFFRHSSEFRKGNFFYYFFLSLIIYYLVILSWAFVNIPEKFGKLFLLNRIPSFRLPLSIGLIEFSIAAMAFRFLPHLNVSSFNKNEIKKLKLITILCWILFLLIGYLFLLKYNVNISSQLLFALFLSGLIGLFFWKNQKIFLALLFCIINIAGTFWFNPIVQGGSEYLQNNNLSSRIIEVNKRIKKDLKNKPVWAFFSTWTVGNFPKIIGIKSLTGAYFYPPFKMWNILDPKQENKEMYNRYGYVTFKLPSGTKSEFAIDGYYDQVIVTIHPDSPKFLSLNVNAIVIDVDLHGAQLNSFKNWSLIEKTEKFNIYLLKDSI